MKSLWPIFAVARNEFRLGLRRGWPVVGTIAVGLPVSVGMLYLGYLNMEGLSRDYAPEAGASALAMVWAIFPSLALGVMPLVTAPAIPADRQFGVDELLRSLSLTGGVYLLGKVAGTLMAVSFSGLVVLMVHLGLHWVVLGPFNAGLYLTLILVSAGPLLAWASTMGVLAACGLHSRRAAVFLGIVVGMLGPFVWGLMPPQYVVPRDPVLAWLNEIVTRQRLSEFVFTPYAVGLSRLPVPTGWQVSVSLLVAFMSLWVVGGLARLWLAWKEGF